MTAPTPLPVPAPAGVAAAEVSRAVDASRRAWRTLVIAHLAFPVVQLALFVAVALAPAGGMLAWGLVSVAWTLLLSELWLLDRLRLRAAAARDRLREAASLL